jgi:Helix-turn-helix domain
VSTLALTLPDDVLATIAAQAAELVDRRRRFLSKPSLAEHYGVSERTVRTWREKGMPGIRVGREVMYEVEAVDSWIESHA